MPNRVKPWRHTGSLLSDQWWRTVESSVRRYPLEAPFIGRSTILIVITDGDRSRTFLEFDKGLARFARRSKRVADAELHMDSAAAERLLFGCAASEQLAMIHDGGIRLVGCDGPLERLLGWRFLAERPDLAHSLRLSERPSR